MFLYIYKINLFHSCDVRMSFNLCFINYLLLSPHLLPRLLFFFLRPQDIVSDIYPHFSTITDSLDDNGENSSFDKALGEIINIIVSFDTGWSKRGNGRSYDSLNGYSTIIGFLSGKVLDYATRNRKCRMCDLGHGKDTHDCRLNYEGSAKAMEADAGTQLVNHSKILEEAGLQVRVIVGDEDSSMMAAVRKDKSEVTFHKLSDKNHLTKNVSNELYKMRDKFKQLNRRGVIAHIKKCFSYAVAQNKGKSENLAKELKKIPDHLFGSHENCGNWCKPKKKHTILLSDKPLYHALVTFFSTYAENAHKFSVAASSQANESFNNIVANKAHKNKCLSRSAACDFRVADSVCVKNDGEHSLLNVQKTAGLTVGTHTIKFASVADSKRLRRAEKSKLRNSKLRRIKLKNDREILRKKKEQSEGITYQTNCGISETRNLINSNQSLSKINTTIVYFDLETGGLNLDADILQIAAKSGDHSFNVYVKPTKKMSSSASEVTGLRQVKDDLYLRTKKLDTVEIIEALQSFLQFLTSISINKKCLLVAHNARFDTPRLLQAIKNNNLINDFEIIAAFSDTLLMFKKMFPERKGPNMFKLETLANDFLQPDSSGHFHDALFDVTSLQDLVRTFNCEDNLFAFSKIFQECYNQLLTKKKMKYGLQFLTELTKVVSPPILEKLCLCNITFSSLETTYKNEGEKAITHMLSETMENKKPKVTKNSRVISKIIRAIQRSLS